jgi:hypothetical protein
MVYWFDRLINILLEIIVFVLFLDKHLVSPVLDDVFHNKIYLCILLPLCVLHEFQVEFVLTQELEDYGLFDQFLSDLDQLVVQAIISAVLVTWEHLLKPQVLELEAWSGLQSEVVLATILRLLLILLFLLLDHHLFFFLTDLLLLPFF